MKSMNLIVLGVGTVIIFISKESAALSCLQCSYNSYGGPGSNASCNDPPTAVATPCDQGVGCMKEYSKTKSGKISITRSCDSQATNDDFGDPTNACFTYTWRGITISRCECTTDSCNFAVSSNFPLPMVAILGLAFGAAVLANSK